MCSSAARGARPVIESHGAPGNAAWRIGWARTSRSRRAKSVRAVKDATGITAPTRVIESTAWSNRLRTQSRWMRSGGTIVLFGIYTASEGSLPFYQLYYKEPTVISARAAMSEDFPESIDLVASGRIRLSPLVTQVLPVSELAHALGMLERDTDGRMKIILEN
jgi:threonine dehydrogenase-like Zn-dependent dehydrogenase